MNGVYSGDTLPKMMYGEYVISPKMMYGEYVINRDEFKSIETHWIVFYVNGDHESASCNAISFNSF